tara:strand:- start:48 stop:284 length:237 start_codon:yes stop_codon:yes gene_type:complete
MSSETKYINYFDNLSISLNIDQISETLQINSAEVEVFLKASNIKQIPYLPEVRVFCRHFLSYLDSESNDSNQKNSTGF